jgi:hypothetical protein
MGVGRHATLDDPPLEEIDETNGPPGVDNPERADRRGDIRDLRVGIHGEPIRFFLKRVTRSSSLLDSRRGDGEVDRSIPQRSMFDYDYTPPAFLPSLEAENGLRNVIHEGAAQRFQRAIPKIPPDLVRDQHGDRSGERGGKQLGQLEREGLAAFILGFLGEGQSIVERRRIDHNQTYVAPSVSSQRARGLDGFGLLVETVGSREQQAMQDILQTTPCDRFQPIERNSFGVDVKHPVARQGNVGRDL